VVFHVADCIFQLDRGSVKWLEDYLISQPHVTSLIVSHDSGFLDTVCTDIIHYENKKLAYYPGNLSAFVEKKPEAKSYYSLAATTIKFSFPQPGSLMGVRSNTRAILKMINCTFTYPGRDKPSLINVSCALSLSSRVGIIGMVLYSRQISMLKLLLGPNGAGKSTMIKLLTVRPIRSDFIAETDLHPSRERPPHKKVLFISTHLCVLVMSLNIPLTTSV